MTIVGAPHPDHDAAAEAGRRRARRTAVWLGLAVLALYAWIVIGGGSGP